MSAKLNEVVYKRLFENVFVCLKCKRKMKANPQKIRLGKVHCRNCGYNRFRPKSKEGRR
jgi:ribosomal protein L40E